LGAALAIGDALRAADRLGVEHRVTVTPNYSVRSWCFRSVETDDKTPANRNNYDLVVTSAGRAPTW